MKTRLKYQEVPTKIYQAKLSKETWSTIVSERNIEILERRINHYIEEGYTLNFIEERTVPQIKIVKESGKDE